MARMTAADAAVAILRREGVAHAFGVPGAAINPFYAALRRDGSINHVLARHVEAASHMAEGYTRARAGNIGVCIGTSGPAGTANGERNRIERCGGRNEQAVPLPAAETDVGDGLRYENAPEAAAVRRGRATPAVRTKFQAVAMLLRDERARVQAAPGNGSHRAEQLKRLDGIAAILAAAAVQDAGLLALLAEDSGVSDAARSLKREMMQSLGIEPAPEETAPAETATVAADPEPRVVPQSVISRQLANPFLAPDFSAVPQRTSRPRRLANWELLGPLLSSFEQAAAGAPACMALPAPTARSSSSRASSLPQSGLARGTSWPGWPAPIRRRRPRP